MAYGTDGGEQAGESTPIKSFALEANVAAPPASIRIGELGFYYGLRRFHLGLWFLTCLLCLPMAMVIGTGPYVLAVIQKELLISDASASLVVTSIFLGSIPGVFFIGPLGDRVGRRMILIGLILTLGLGVLMHLVIPHNGGNLAFGMLVSLRMVLGLAYGGLIVALPAYQIDFWPDSARGLGMASTLIGWPIGGFVSICLVRFIGATHWRVCLALIPLPGLLVALVALFLLPESPRWQLIVGQKKRAQSALDQIFASPPIYGEAFVGDAPDVVVERQVSTLTVSSWDLFLDAVSSSMLQTTVVCVTMYTCIAGVSNIMWIWGPEILSRVTGHHFHKDLGVFQWAEISQLFAAPMGIICVDSIGRRVMAMFAFSFSCFCVIMLFLPSPSLPQACSLWILKNLSDCMIWLTVGVYTSEAFPTAIRGTALGATTVLGRVAAVFMPWAAGLIIDKAFKTLLIGCACLYALAAVSAWFIPRETMGKATSDERPSRK